MKYFWQLAIFFFALVLIITPLPAQAGSSSVVTSVSSAYSNADLTGEDFSGRNLQKIEFTSVRLNSANLSNADLRGVVFNSVQLNQANLQGADFTDGIAYLSNFNQADLTDTVLVDAILLRSTFDNADITGADFSFASLDLEQRKKLCASASGVNSKTGMDTRESLECR